MRLLVVTLFCLLAMTHADEAWPNKKCHALILEGGGDKGSYEAGALWGFIENMDPKDVEWDYIDGISAGGINAAYVLTSKPGTEKIMVEDLIALWRDISRKDVYKSWPGGILYSVISEPSIFNNQPLRKYIQEHLVGRTI